MKAIESVLSTLEVGAPVLAGNLAAFPLFRPTQAPMDYLLLDEALERDLAAYEKAIEVAEGQAGAVFASGGRVIGLEFFDSPAAFARCFAKIVRAYAMDAREEVDPIPKSATLADVRRFLDEMTKAAMQKYAALGEGEDVRLENLAGGALVDGERVVHLAAYRVGAG